VNQVKHGSGETSERRCGTKILAGLGVKRVTETGEPNDKQQLEPMLGKIDALPEELGELETLLADGGYFSAANVEACEKTGIEPLIAMGRQPHHPPLKERFETAPPAKENPTPVVHIECPRLISDEELAVG
jgi:IS5 family transposase